MNSHCLGRAIFLHVCVGVALPLVNAFAIPDHVRTDISDMYYVQVKYLSLPPRMQCWTVLPTHATCCACSMPYAEQYYSFVPRAVCSQVLRAPIGLLGVGDGTTGEAVYKEYLLAAGFDV